MPEAVGRIVRVSQHGGRFRIEVLEADGVRVYSWFSRLSPGKSYRIQYGEKPAANGGPPFRNIASAEPLPHANNNSAGPTWEPPPGFRKPRPNPTACVMISAKQWNTDHPDTPVTQTMLCVELKGRFRIQAAGAREGLTQLRPEEALELAGLIARGELAGLKFSAEGKKGW